MIVVKFDSHISTRMWQVGFEYSACDLLCVSVTLVGGVAQW